MDSRDLKVGVCRAADDPEWLAERLRHSEFWDSTKSIINAIMRFHQVLRLPCFSWQARHTRFSFIFHFFVCGIHYLVLPNFL